MRKTHANPGASFAWRVYIHTTRTRSKSDAAEQTDVNNRKVPRRTTLPPARVGEKRDGESLRRPMRRVPSFPPTRGARREGPCVGELAPPLLSLLSCAPELFLERHWCRGSAQRCAAITWLLRKFIPLPSGIYRFGDEFYGRGACVCDRIDD